MKAHETDVLIIGAGAAGLMAAGSVKNHTVTVLERNEKSGKKLYITGKGRCNVTNDCSVGDCVAHVVSNPKFLFSALHAFTPTDTRALLSEYGCETKVERGGRVFPVSDKASDVIKALYLRAEQNGATFCFNTRVQRIEKTEDGFCVRTETGDYACRTLLLATGGKSYPQTGSEGDGYAFAKALGHTVTPLRPSLVPLRLKESVSELAGVSLKNVSVTLSDERGKSLSRFGEMLFTHDGVSGPVVLWLSAHFASLTPPVRLSIDLKPALDAQTLDKRFVREAAENGVKTLKNMLCRLLPKALVLPVLAQSGVSPNKKGNELTKEERGSLGTAMKNLSFTVLGTHSFDEAVVTSGGVCVKELDPKTMRSKLVKNLYFAGELIDIDAVTGGFNIQLAFSTAQAAAKAISEDA